MYDITINFIDGSSMKVKGNFIIEGSFIRINYDHDKDKKTPQRTTVFPVHCISNVDCEVIQSGVR